MNNQHSFSLTFRNEDHFKKVIKWLNNNIGHGRQFWTMEGRVLKHLKNGHQITRTVHIRVKDFDEANALFLALL